MKTKELSNETVQEEIFPIRSSLYQRFLEERGEILRHKWLESEKAGQDIGFDAALLSWVRNHRKEWNQARRKYPTSFSS